MHNREYTVFSAAYAGRFDAAHHVLRGGSAQGGGFGPARRGVERRKSKWTQQLIEALAAEWDPENIRHISGKCGRS